MRDHYYLINKYSNIENDKLIWYEDSDIYPYLIIDLLIHISESMVKKVDITS